MHLEAIFGPESDTSSGRIGASRSSASSSTAPALPRCLRAMWSESSRRRLAAVFKTHKVTGLTCKDAVASDDLGTYSAGTMPRWIG